MDCQLVVQGTSCKIRISNLQNSPRILRFKHNLGIAEDTYSSHFSDSAGYIHSFEGCRESFSERSTGYCQDTFQSNEEKFLLVQSNTATDKGDSIKNLVLIFELPQASGKKSMTIFFNDKLHGSTVIKNDINMTRFRPESYTIPFISQQELSSKGFKMQLLDCYALNNDLNFDGINDGMCLYTITNNNKSPVKIQLYSSNAVDIQGNKHDSIGSRFASPPGLSFDSRKNEFVIYRDDFPDSTQRFGHNGSEIIYPGVTARIHLFIKNIFPDNTSLKNVNVRLKIKGLSSQEEDFLAFSFQRTNIPIKKSPPKPKP
jgi:hypothetical protein